MPPSAHQPPLKMRTSTTAAAGEPFAAQMTLLHGGGISRAIRCICVISVALTEPPAGTKCQFSA